jgi:GGDEF domain-containing protein
MSSELRSLTVVVVSTDVSLLHEVSWVLDAVGYVVQTTNDISQDALWRRFSLPDFLIVDGRNIAEPATDTFAVESDNPLYRIFLYDPAKPTDLAAWYAAGAHDALRTPVSRGEVLARVRTGARYLEFERRLQSQSSQCAVPGMYSRRGLVRKLRKLAASDSPASSQHTLMVTSLDWYVGIRRKCGETVGRSLVNAAARAIKRTAGESALSAYFGDGRFATLLVGQPVAVAKVIAESLAKDFGSRESLHESVPRPTLTSAVTPWTAGSKAERVIADALETLDLARHSGCGCVVADGDFSKELAAWREEMSTGNPFTNVVAQDIMEPFPVLLPQHGGHSELLAALRRSGVPVRPYVDRDGRLVGVAADKDAAPQSKTGQPAGVTGESLAMPETISHDASFPDIYEAFSSRGCNALVVTAGDQPLGYITCDGFLSTIDPVNAESFSQTDKSVDELAHLIVPSWIGEAAAAVEPAGV